MSSEVLMVRIGKIVMHSKLNTSVARPQPSSPVQVLNSQPTPTAQTSYHPIRPSTISPTLKSLHPPKTAQVQEAKHPWETP